MRKKYKSKKEGTIFYQNPFYNDVFGHLVGDVPSKRIRYKIDKKAKAIKIYLTQSSRRFEESMRKSLSKNPHPKWPYKGNILISISASLSKKDWETKDIDNIAKSILDALKGIVFIDDIQVSVLHIIKYPSKYTGFMLGVKELQKDNYASYFPPLCQDKPWENEQIYKITARPSMGSLKTDKQK